jgi:hypothetical protein
MAIVYYYSGHLSFRAIDIEIPNALLATMDENSEYSTTVSSPVDGTLSLDSPLATEEEVQALRQQILRQGMSRIPRLYPQEGRVEPTLTLTALNRL